MYWFVAFREESSGGNTLRLPPFGGFNSPPPVVQARAKTGLDCEEPRSQRDSDGGQTGLLLTTDKNPLFRCAVIPRVRRLWRICSLFEISYEALAAGIARIACIPAWLPSPSRRCPH
jgi:hypothetical protein